MKKILSIILIVILSITPVVAFAATESYPAETQVMMGDLNGDKQITAADARTALRVSAHLQSSDGISLSAIDADNSGSIAAADARMILRVAAKIDSFSCGFDKDGVANQINTFSSGKYCIELVAEKTDLTLAISGDTCYFNWPEMAEETVVGSMRMSGIIIKNDKIYLLINDSIAMEIVPEMLGSDDDTGFSLTDIKNIRNTFTSFAPKSFTRVEKVTVNNVPLIAYNYKSSDGSSNVIYTDLNGVMKSIESTSQASFGSDGITIKSISANVPEKYISLDGYDKM